jgi:hypothetical protein
VAKGKKTGGRQKGTPNRRTQARREQAAALGAGVLPLDFLLAVMRDEVVDAVRRLDAAKAAAPYVHPRLTAVEHSGPDGPIEIAYSSLEEMRRVAFLFYKVAQAGPDAEEPAS